MSPATASGVDTFVDEGLAFGERHRIDLPDGPRAWGSMAWGFMRALAECPNCPGVFRVPLDKEWVVLACTSCEMMWRRDPAVDPFAAPVHSATKRRRGGEVSVSYSSVERDQCALRRRYR